MKSHSRLIVFILLVYISSLITAEAIRGISRTYLQHSALARQLNGGDKMSDVITKYNERRAAGILAQPRVGRTMGAASLIRSDGPTGLVHYPRVGRSGHSSSFNNINDNNPLKFGPDPGEQSRGNFNSELSMDLDYQERLDSDEKTWKPIDISTRGIFWAATKPRRETRREQQHLRLFRSEGDNDENWIALPVQFQDFSNIEQQQQESSQDVSKFTREINHA
ncbi:uncharacterized protein LOC130671637 isoform X1 [Microplitis mediator]|uniref:uncharacterized protein LOC130671637 isoform X1 n=2 Tax=Microplitis mediator TaxID=375433 RepID=UPI0025545A7B|nr:uncharacterized protein LOC130671637 isoform X1 [Microplitis mediator]